MTHIFAIKSQASYAIRERRPAFRGGRERIEKAGGRKGSKVVGGGGGGGGGGEGTGRVRSGRVE